MHHSACLAGVSIPCTLQLTPLPWRLKSNKLLHLSLPPPCLLYCCLLGQVLGYKLTDDPKNFYTPAPFNLWMNVPLLAKPAPSFADWWLGPHPDQKPGGREVVACRAWEHGGVCSLGWACSCGRDCRLGGRSWRLLKRRILE